MDAILRTEFAAGARCTGPVTRRIVVDKNNSAGVHPRPKKPQPFDDRLIDVTVDRDEGIGVLADFVGYRIRKHADDPAVALIVADDRPSAVEAYVFEGI